jgi:hypothetical protein
MKPAKIISLPRIIGIVLILLAVLAYRTQGILKAGIIGTAGLVLLLASNISAGKNWQAFVASLKPKKQFVVLMLFDMLFWTMLAILMLLFALAVKGPYEQAKAIQLGEGITIGAIAGFNNILTTFFTTTIISLIVFLVLAIIAYSTSRGLIWTMLTNKKQSRKLFAKLCWLNLLWCTAWLAVFFLLSIGLKPVIGAYSLIIGILLYAHLTTILHREFAITGLIRQSVRASFAKGLGRISAFAQPYAYIFVVYLLLSQLLRINIGKTQVIIAFIAYLAFMAWYRTYLNIIARQVQ